MKRYIKNNSGFENLQIDIIYVYILHLFYMCVQFFMKNY